jgi:hypothetical protein
VSRAPKLIILFWDPAFYQSGAPGVFGGKFTVHPSALDFTDLSSSGDQKGYPKAAPFRPAKSRLLAYV